MFSHQANSAQCVSVFLWYDRICDHLHGYQDGNQDAFRPYYNNHMCTIDNPFIDGAALTYGF